MCWAVPAVVLDIDDKNSLAYVDIGDGVPRPVVIGIANERISKGDLVMVHAGVIITRLDLEAINQFIEEKKELARELALMAGDDPEKAVREVEEEFNKIFEIARRAREGERGVVREMW
jgi:hydrogenase expression/formation protein HypC